MFYYYFCFQQSLFFSSTASPRQSHSVLTKACIKVTYRHTKILLLPEKSSYFSECNNREKTNTIGKTFSTGLHQLLPLEIAEDGDDDIQPVKRGLEGDVLVEIEPAGDHIDDNPHEPLFQILARQSPDTHDAQGGSEGIQDGDGGIGEVRQDEIDDYPDHDSEAEPDEGHAFGYVADGEIGGFLLMTHPSNEAVDGHGEIIELHAAVGVKAFLIVQYDAQRLHHKAHDPHPDAGFVFQQNVGQAEGGGRYVKPMR